MGALLAILGLGALIAFLGVLIVWVPHTDLIVITLVVIALAVYDFWRSRFSMSGRKR